VRAAFYLLIGLIGISPVLFFFDGPIIAGLLNAYTAVMLAVVGLSIRPGEAEYFSKVTRPIFICATIPAAWLLIQILPMPSSIAHPFWTSAQAALNHAVTASISLDRGATLLAFTNYCFAAGVIFVATAVTIDRARAEFVMFWLAGITTLAAVLLIADQFDVFINIAKTAGFTPTASLTAVAALGVIVNAAALVRVIERYETRRTSSQMPSANLLRGLSVCVVALAICICAIISFATMQIVFATMSGLATFIIVMMIRRFGLDLWMNAIIALAAVVIGVAIVSRNMGSGDLTLRFASSPQALIQVAQSMLSDTPWMGNGAGAFGSLLPIYQDIDRSVVGLVAPTSAATIAIELGRPALWVILFLAFVVFFQLTRGALERGRDSFYPTAGASCVVLVTVQAFCHAALLEKPTIIVVAIILGLAVAQSVSRTGQTSAAR
jgi:UPF0716 family protein affecting phage T7 exclusion